VVAAPTDAVPLEADVVAAEGRCGRPRGRWNGRHRPAPVDDAV